MRRRPRWRSSTRRISRRRRPIRSGKRRAASTRGKCLPASLCGKWRESWTRCWLNGGRARAASLEPPRVGYTLSGPSTMAVHGGSSISVSVGSMEPEVLGAPSGGAKTHSQGEGAHRHKRDGAPPNEGETQVPKEPTRRYHCEKDDGAEEHGAAEVRSEERRGGKERRWGWSQERETDWRRGAAARRWRGSEG